MEKILLKKLNTSLFIGNNILTQVISEFKKKSPNSTIFLIADNSVYKIYKKKIELALGKKTASLLLPSGENTKSSKYLNQIYDFLLKNKADRKAQLVALGGGVIGDLVGYAAATYMRGIDLIQIPTSLLAQVDSSIGGKTAINHPLAKNSIGVFKQPLVSIIDTNFLASLSERNFVSGYAEIIKHAIIKDASFFENLYKLDLKKLQKNKSLIIEIISRSCHLKAKVVEKDETENSLRAILNFGHSLAHLIETHTKYKTYLHGEAVIGGMDFAIWWSKKHLKLATKTYQKVRELLLKQDIKIELKNITKQKFCSLLARDKKNFVSGINFIGIKALGKVTICKKVSIESIWQDFLEYQKITDNIISS